MAVRIVTDSTCDLPPALVEAHGITVVPLTVYFGDEALRDGIDIHPEEFYDKLKASDALPKTSQPAAALFEEAYREAAKDGDEIVSIHLSSKLSGTLNAASVAREAVSPEIHVDLIDSYTVSLGLALVVLEAARVAQAAGTREEVVAAARSAMERVSIYVCLDTLEYLRKGGRIGRAQSVAGSVLSIKPILSVENGEVTPFERVRTRNKAVERIFAIAAGMGRARQMFVACSGNDDEARAFMDRLRPHLPHTDLLLGHLGPVVGVYAGPGAIGVAALERE